MVWFRNLFRGNVLFSVFKSIPCDTIESIWLNYSPITGNNGSNFSSASDSNFQVKMTPFFVQCECIYKIWGHGDNTPKPSIEAHIEALRHTLRHWGTHWGIEAHTEDSEASPWGLDGFELLEVTAGWGLKGLRNISPVGDVGKDAGKGSEKRGLNK